MNLVFIAPLAAGKGTISTLLNKKYGMECISMGQLLRDVDPESELGKKIQNCLSNRILVGNDIVGELLKDYLNNHEFSNGFILDGFPREIGQVEILNKIEEAGGPKIDYCVYLNVDHDTALRRTIGRRNCPNCKRVYNVMTGYNMPKEENKCDDCGVELVKRADDNEETFNKGWTSYNKLAEPCIEFYKKKGNLIEVDSSVDANITFKELEEKLGLNND